MVVTVFFTFLITGYQHPDVGAPDTAFHTFLRDKFHTGNAKAVQFLKNSLRIGKQFQQCGGEHITGGTHGAV